MMPQSRRKSSAGSEASSSGMTAAQTKSLLTSDQSLVRTFVTTDPQVWNRQNDEYSRRVKADTPANAILRGLTVGDAPGQISDALIEPSRPAQTGFWAALTAISTASDGGPAMQQDFVYKAAQASESAKHWIKAKQALLPSLGKKPGRKYILQQLITAANDHINLLDRNEIEMRRSHGHRERSVAEAMRKTGLRWSGEDMWSVAVRHVRSETNAPDQDFTCRQMDAFRHEFSITRETALEIMGLLERLLDLRDRLVHLAAKHEAGTGSASAAGQQSQHAEDVAAAAAAAEAAAEALLKQDALEQAAKQKKKEKAGKKAKKKKAVANGVPSGSEAQSSQGAALDPPLKCKRPCYLRLRRGMLCRSFPLLWLATLGSGGVSLNGRCHVLPACS